MELNASVHELGWWIEILTAQPMCLYYFGPFIVEHEAECLKTGFIEDLLVENALILSTNIQFLQPSQVTLTGENLRSKVHVFRRNDKNRIAIGHPV